MLTESTAHPANCNLMYAQCTALGTNPLLQVHALYTVRTARYTYSKPSLGELAMYASFLVTLFRQNPILELAFNLSVKSTLEIDPSGVVLQNNLVSRKRPAGATRGFGTLYDTYEEAVQAGLACGSRRRSGSGSWTPRGHVPVGNVLQIDPLEVRSLVQT